MLGALAISISYHQRSRTSASDAIRRRALERLYERRETLNELIDTLQRYQEERRRLLAPCIDISVARKCSLGSVR
ncbi:MAG TPA: hypothetical protein VMS37_12480 [Verrucomicrobiae bacterium]|nr:hypothetical protein [Verrucomicrobiae bacterium]